MKKWIAVLVLVMAVYVLMPAETDKGKNAEEFGECVLGCLEFNADIPEELNDPKLGERCRLLCENPEMEFDTALEFIDEYGEL